MMQKESFTVKYITVNNCFVKLPEYWLRKLGDQNPILKISHGKKCHFVTYASKPSPDNALRISATFARTLDIKEDEQVFVSSVQNMSLLTSITVVPKTAHDLDIVALQKDKIQLTLLQQIRVVAKYQAIVVWVSKFSYVTLVTECLKPNVAYGMLEEFTEVQVSDVAACEQESTGEQTAIRNTEKLAVEILKKRLQKEAADDDLVTSEIKALVKSFRNRTTPYIFRVCNLPKMKCPFGRNSKFDEIMCAPFHAFVLKRQLPKGINLTDTGVVHCKITKIPQDRQNVAGSKSTNFLRGEKGDDLEAPSELMLDLYLIEEIREKCSQSIQDAFKRYYYDTDTKRIDWLYRGIHNVIYLSDTAMTNLKLKTGSKIILQLSSQEQDMPLSHIRIYPHTPLVTKQDSIRYVKKFSKFNMLLLNSSCTIVEDSVPQFTMKFMPECCTWARLCTPLLEKIEIIEHTKVDFKRIDDIPKRPEKKKLAPVSIECQEIIREKCKASLILTLGLENSVNFEVARENILICGEMGSGKTTLCNLLIEQLETGPYFVHTTFIDCKPLKGKKVEVLQKILTSAIVECAYYQPSLLILENLECITNVSTNDAENTPDSINAARTTDMIINVVMRYQETRYVSVIGTCRSADKLGRRLRPAKGADFFRTVYTIKNPNKDDRCALMMNVLEQSLDYPGRISSIIKTYGQKTEGWTPQDITDTCLRAVFEGRKRYAKRGNVEEMSVTEEDMKKAFGEYTPLSLRDLPLHKDSKYSWSDIGGLNNVKRYLIETIQWPLMYPEIFRKSPIKLQNGVLIYGMPGTGKTMLAKAIANECKVNLISVKGPELLSKYIGVSEESVRNVFQRALRAKPCVLFFDEFDSLAPRRGHDSTGVTDRVVNQLLTQLDGVEDREGVVVVAASSRPDLLDPALLRPGRLDKCLYCRLPGDEDRWEILKALCRTLKVDVEELDLMEIVQLSAGFTGADLNAVFTQARLSALEEAVAAVPSGKLRVEDIRVTLRHLVDSVKNTRPSLSQMEKEMYNKIYVKFSNGGNFTEEVLKNQRATLA